MAEPWYRITESDSPLEGPAFERDGSLLFSNIGASEIVRLTPDRRASVVVQQRGTGFGGLAVHKDGRIIAAAIDRTGKTGFIGFLRPGEQEFHVVVPRSAGYVPNDLVFDAPGGFYFSDFRGTTTEPRVGI